MRRPLPHSALVQVTWSSRVFWRHLQDTEQVRTCAWHMDSQLRHPRGAGYAAGPVR